MGQTEIKISKEWEHNGYKYVNFADGLYYFRRWFEGRLQTVKATQQDIENGFVYKLIDGGLSRV